MRKLYRKLTAILLAICVLVSPVLTKAAEQDDNAEITREYVETVDLGDGFTAVSYVEYVDALSPIQPRVATQGNATKYTQIYNGDKYVCTILQTATFVYGAPNEVVIINSKRAIVYSYDSSSPYRVGTITTRTANGSPATVTSSFGIFRASDWSWVASGTVIMYCYNSGLYD